VTTNTEKWYILRIRGESLPSILGEESFEDKELDQNGWFEWAALPDENIQRRVIKTLNDSFSDLEYELWEETREIIKITIKSHIMLSGITGGPKDVD
jgi:hypothetical protein